MAFLLGRDGKDFSVDEDYARSIIKSGAEIRFISYDNIEEQIKKVDGVILPGGCFNSPTEWYNQKKNLEDLPSTRSLAYVRAIIQSKKQGIPMLGICAGMQMMTEMEGYQDGIRMHHNIKQETSYIEAHKGIAKSDIAHDVKIYKDSKLFEITGKTTMPINSNHNEAIMRNSIADNFGSVKVAAISSDGIVEAVELKNHPSFALGVQWHPETWASRHNDEISQNIFNSFTKACFEYQKVKELKNIKESKPKNIIDELMKYRNNIRE